jgi:FkbM family methyltransferase
MNAQPRTDKPAAYPRLKAAGFFRALNKGLPLGRKYHRFISLVNPTTGLFTIPFGHYEVVHPASWGSEMAAVLLMGENLTPEFCLLPPILKNLKSGYLVDLGANIGLYVLKLRSLSPLPIIAYEPQPFLHSLVQANVEHNRLPQVDVRLVACGGTRGELAFQTGINGGIVTGETATSASATGSVDEQAEATRRTRPVIRVPVVTLNEDLKDVPVALLKIDCEGFEQQILNGAMNVIEKQRPYLLLEVHPQEIGKHGGSPAEVLTMLKPHYELEFWDFSRERHYPKFIRSALKHRKPRGHCFANEQEMLKACETEPIPSQIYFLGRPKTA